MDFPMSETAANPLAGPAMSVDDIVDRLNAEDAAADATNAPEAEAQAADPGATSAEPDPAEATEAQAEPVYTVKVRGVEQQVTLQELQAGYSRNEDYRAKTAEVAEQRRAVEAKSAEFAARASQLDELLSRAPFDPVLANGQRTDWATLARENPAEYVARKEEHEARVNYWRQVQHHAQETRFHAASAERNAGEQRMAELVPEWRDEGKRKALADGLSKTLESYGFKPEEYGSVNDPRILLVARDAMLFRQQQAARKAAEAKKAAPAPSRTLSPGTAQSSSSNGQARALFAKAARTGRIDDQVNAILATLE